MSVFTDRQIRSGPEKRPRPSYLFLRSQWMIPLFLLILLVYGCANSLTRQQNQALMEILGILNAGIEDAEKAMTDNPDPTGQFGDILDKLTYMKEIIEKIKKGNAPYDEELINRYMVKIEEIEANIKNSVDRTLSSDVFFGLGKYKISDLSEKGQGILREFTDTIIRVQVGNFRKLFPERSFRVFIKVVGYADETPPGEELSGILRQEIREVIPSDSLERKKLFNKKLSFLRAFTISGFIQQQLESLAEKEDIRMGPPEIIGMGEELPYPADYVSPPYESQDERRRICKIYSRIQIDIPE